MWYLNASIVSKTKSKPQEYENDMQNCDKVLKIFISAYARQYVNFFVKRREKLRQQKRKSISSITL